MTKPDVLAPTLSFLGQIMIAGAILVLAMTVSDLSRRSGNEARPLAPDATTPMEYTVPTPEGSGQ